MARSVVVVLAAICSALSLFLHFVGLGAFFGAVLCAILWRKELWPWAHETWRRFWAFVYRV